ncbi:MAG: hypothetical protein WB560_16050 [Desulfobaccales bacterium]
MTMQGKRQKAKVNNHQPLLPLLSPFYLEAKPTMTKQGKRQKAKVKSNNQLPLPFYF